MTTIAASSRYRFGHFELQPDERRLLVSGTPVHVGPHAFDLLIVLVERAGHLVTKDELLERVWPSVVVEENTLQAHISALRKILGPKAIATISGRGYRFTPEVNQVAERAPVFAPKHNLPHLLTSFIGREKEIAELTQLFATTRLVTLTGAGGCGKTRLATKVAGELCAAHSHGAWLVELAALTDLSLIPQTVANVLAIKEQPGKSLAETLADQLASRHMLLVLDNAEHLLEGCAQLTEALLLRCATLTILVTSRERLGVLGEVVYRVPSLSVPEERDATLEQISRYESVRLFIDRARLQQPHFAITTRDAAALVSICRRLDGVALAIELAAPRVRSMSMEELSRHLDQRFGLLTEGSRTALPRQRTLRALIDWSYDLLSEAEKSVLRRLSVFSGGWTLEAAAKICGGDDVQGTETFDLLMSLVDKSLVLAEVSSKATRYGFLESVRHYARDRLRESGEEARTQQQHPAHFLALTEDAERQVMGADRAVWLDRLESERDNLRAALSWSLSAGGDAASGLRLAGAVAYFWWLRGYIAEGRGWLSEALAAAASGEDAAARAKVCHAAGILAYSADDCAAAQAFHEEALAIFRRLGHRHAIGRSLNNLGNVAAIRGDYRTARTMFEEALTIHGETGDRRNAAGVLVNLGILASDEGDPASARAFLEQGLTIARDVGGWITVYALSYLGNLAHRRGDDAAAQTMLEEGLALGRKEGSWVGTSIALAGLAEMARSRGDHDSALALLKEVIVIQRDVGDRRSIAQSLESLAAVVLVLARPRAAARMWGGAGRLRDEIGATMRPDQRHAYERDVAVARGALHDDAAFDLAWSEGSAMTLEQLVQFALDIGSSSE